MWFWDHIPVAGSDLHFCVGKCLFYKTPRHNLGSSVIRSSCAKLGILPWTRHEQPQPRHEQLCPAIQSRSTLHFVHLASLNLFKLHPDSLHPPRPHSNALLHHPGPPQSRHDLQTLWHDFIRVGFLRMSRAISTNIDDAEDNIVAAENETGKFAV